MSRSTTILVTITLLTGANAVGGAAQTPVPDSVHTRALPSWADSALTRFLADSGFTTLDRVTPRFQVADLDGDGFADAAVLVKRTNSGEEGIVVFRRYGRSPIVLGAGAKFGDAGADFKWMTAWHTVRHGRIATIYAEHSESGGGYIAWDGHRFKPFVGDD